MGRPQGVPVAAPGPVPPRASLVGQSASLQSARGSVMGVAMGQAPRAASEDSGGEGGGAPGIIKSTI